MMYDLLRPLLFRLDAENAHHITFKIAQIAYHLRLLSKQSAWQGPVKPLELMNLHFPNAVGLAAGLDKNGDYIDILAAMGFGYIEIGTVTPKPQDGNPRPRLFRVPDHLAVINRMGFNNKGMHTLIRNVTKSEYYQNKGILGINIGKNALTPIENAHEDYLIALDAVYPYSSYITINISSPNTKNLRQLQEQDELSNLLLMIKTRQLQLADASNRYVPIVLKIAPDLDHDQIQNICQLLVEHEIDGVIATNTTLDKTAIKHTPFFEEVGGLSGRPLTQKAHLVTSKLRECLPKDFPIIGVGGIMQGSDAVERVQSGAQLIQLYSGLVYEGPELIGECIEALKEYSPIQATQAPASV